MSPAPNTDPDDTTPAAAPTVKESAALPRPVLLGTATALQLIRRSTTS